MKSIAGPRHGNKTAFSSDRSSSFIRVKNDHEVTAAIASDRVVNMLVYRFLRKVYVKGSVAPRIVCGGVDSTFGEHFREDQIPLKINEPDVKVGQRIWDALDYLI